MIPDAPGLPPWVKAHAEYEGTYVSLIDLNIAAKACICLDARSRWHNFTVGVGKGNPLSDGHLTDCPIRQTPGYGSRSVLTTDDDAEALAVFERERDRLTEEEA